MRGGRLCRLQRRIRTEDGAEKEMLTRLIAAMSADAGDDAQDFIKRLMEHAGPALNKELAAIDPGTLKLNKPEDVIAYLLTKAGKGDYNENEEF